MSRIAKYPVVIPEKVDVTLGAADLTVKGPLGTLKQSIARGVVVKRDGNQLTFAPADGSKEANALSGTMRAIVANMVQGVKSGFEKRLSLVGVGYRATVEGKKVVFALGYSHAVEYPIPEGIKVAIDKQTRVTVSGIDRQQVGQVAAEIRDLRKPDPYKQKGIRYVGEVLKKKAGKAGATTGAK